MKRSRSSPFPILLSLAIVAAVPSGSALAEDGDPAARLLRLATSDPHGYDKLAYLTDRIGPRLSGSAGYDAAVRWAVEEFRRDGVDRVWTEKVLVPRWVRGTESASIVSPVVAPMATVALGMSPPTPPEGVTGEVVEVKSLEELEALGDKVRGKIVLFNRPVLPNGGAENGYGPAAALRHDGGTAAAKLGAIGALIRSLGTAAFRLPHTGMTEHQDGVAAVPYAAISQEDADHVHRLLAAGETVKVRMTLGCRFEPDVEQANVAAELRGREKPEEVVVIGCHLDSWDVGTGATDDGAGCAIVMEAMRLVKATGLRPRRTLRAVLFANEENGLRGGKAYAAAHEDELRLHVAAIEADSGGGRPKGFGVTAGEGGVDAVRKIAAPLAAIGAAEIKPGGGGADISPLRAARVPVLGLRQDTTHYFDYHHSAADTLDKVDPRALAECAGAFAVVAFGLADADFTLPRPAPPEEPVPQPRTSR